jgi:rubrerythrin
MTMPGMEAEMNRGNADKVMADAEKIAKRLRETDITLEKLMAEYHCSYYTIRKAVRSQIQQDEWLQIRREHLIRGNIKFHFLPGHKTWNKGKSYNPGGHSVETRFKKGNLPVNHKTLGTITVRVNNRDKRGPYRMIAIAGPTLIRHKWIPYAQYIWEKEHGPLPKGFFVAHVDDNSMNDNPKNLEIVDRKGNMELMKRNNPNWVKKASKTRSKTYRIRRLKKARDLRKAQQKAEQLQKRQARLLRASNLEVEQKKSAELQMLEIYGPQVYVWECSGCVAEYEGENPPAKCTHCNRYSFEKNFYRRKTG